MKLTVKQLKTLIREAAEEAIEETYSRGGEGGNRWGDSWDTGKEEDSYEEAMRKDREARSKPDFYKHDESEVNPYTESLAEAFRAGYRRGLKARRR